MNCELDTLSLFLLIPPSPTNLWQQQQLLRPSLLRPEELSMESGIDPGQDYYRDEYYNYDQGYDLPQYGSRRKLISPMYDEYGELIMEDDYYTPHGSESGVRRKRIKLVVDREYETSSTGEDSAPEPQRNRMSNINSHANINGNVYLAQNGTIVRTRRPGHPNNLKVGSPGRLGKQFKKLDMLTETQEDKLPLNSVGEPVTGNGTGTLTGVSSIVDINLNTRPSSGSLGSSITGLDSIGSKSNIAKALHDRNSRSNCCVDEQESCVDNMASKETLTSHSDHTLSDEEELWMGPWNSLHIPMTKL
ncbi:hypothetical protein J4Q44_G00359540 [Coregonus suidteri]|uniref:Uncharacterized protein n=1 Tax=Coregonus suidteri TaxID=861788 RepID=A0AAN8QEM9_9TELE